MENKQAASESDPSDGKPGDGKGGACPAQKPGGGSGSQPGQQPGNQGGNNPTTPLQNPAGASNGGNGTWIRSS